MAPPRYLRNFFKITGVNDCCIAYKCIGGFSNLMNKTRQSKVYQILVKGYEGFQCPTCNLQTPC